MIKKAMMNRFSKRILITGASSGIGWALAEAYAAPGVYLALTGRNEDRLHAIKDLCEKKGAHVHSHTMDIRDRAAVTQWVGGLSAEQPFDLVIANAGISGGAGAMSYEPPEQILQIFDVNLNGVLYTLEGILPSMQKAGKGQIALMSSLAGFRGWPSAPAYSASKGAVRLLGEGLRGSLEDSGIKVSVICPGFIRTPLTDQNNFPMPFLMAPDKAARIIQKGLKKNKPRIAFPLLTYIGAGLPGLLPEELALKFLKKTPGKNNITEK
jgi:short-subunit dehydrogenase